jgi:hypothetical protein
MNNLLYYPYIDLPRTNWTLRTLLYYDNIGSIVPQEYFFNPHQHDPFMRDLMEADLVTAINPIMELDNPLLSTEPFLQHINNNRDKLERATRRFSMEQKNSPYKLARIHSNKFHDNIFYGLKQMGLAQESNSGWYLVERKIAYELMMFLATIVAAKTKRLPATDYIRPRYYKQTFAKEQAKRETILNQLIPFPEDIDLTRLQRFKDRHSGLLREFRTQVELIVFDPNIREGTQLFHYRVAELCERKDQLTARMNESNFNKIMYGTAAGIIGAFIGLPIGDGWGSLVGAMPGFANTVHSAIQIERAEDIFDQSGMKYLALADKRLSIKR